MQDKLTEIVSKIQDCDWDGIHKLSKDQAAQLIQSYCDQENEKLKDKIGAADSAIYSLQTNLTEATNETERWRQKYGAVCRGFEMKLSALRSLAEKVLETKSQYQFFLEGYRNGSASISEVTRAGDENAKALNDLSDYLKENK